jgi:hypothetical protein
MSAGGASQQYTKPVHKPIDAPATDWYRFAMTQLIDEWRCQEVCA